MQHDALRQYVIGLLDWHDAHATFDDAVKDMPHKLQGVRPDGTPHSAWELLEHIRIAQRDILEFCQDGEYSMPSWPDDYWPSEPAPPTEDAWDDSVRRYYEDLASLREIAEHTPDLFAIVPHGESDQQTYFRELLLTADHTAYHVGQLVIVRRMLGAWPS